MSNIEESLKDRLERQKKLNQESLEEVSQEFITGTGKLLRDFNKKIESGSVVINDLTDLQKIYVVFRDMTSLVQTSSAGAGGYSTPELKGSEMSAFSKAVPDAKEGEDEVDISGLSQEETEELINGVTDAMNSENEKEANSN